LGPSGVDFDSGSGPPFSAIFPSISLKKGDGILFGPFYWGLQGWTSIRAWNKGRWTFIRGEGLYSEALGQKQFWGSLMVFLKLFCCFFCPTVCLEILRATQPSNIRSIEMSIQSFDNHPFQHFSSDKVRMTTRSISIPQPLITGGTNYPEWNII